MEALIATAFVGGILMFLAPCTLPLVPAFFASIAPRSSQTAHGVYMNDHMFIIRSLAFIFGFTLIFVTFGVLAGYLGDTLTHYKTLLSQIGGVFVIIFGLSVLGVFKILTLHKSFSLMNAKLVGKTQNTTPAILGAFFALGWAPCAGPILASILILTSQSATVLEGGFLLFVFSLGLAIPFFLAGYFYGHFSFFLRSYERYYRFVNFVSGIFLILLGIVLVFGKFFIVTQMGFTVYTFFGYVPMCTYY